jgi:hypothetical protein
LQLFFSNLSADVFASSLIILPDLETKSSAWVFWRWAEVIFIDAL